MKEWEKELQIYRLMPAPPKENNLQKYILRYLSKKDDKYISWFLHYYERTINDKVMSIVQDYAMVGHFLDIKQAYIIGMLKALQDYDPNRGVPFIAYKEYAAMREVHEYIRTMRTGFTVQSNDEYLRLRKAMRLFREYGGKVDSVTIQKIAQAIGASKEDTAEIICSGMQNMQFVDYYRQYADEDSEESREEVAADETSETEKYRNRYWCSGKVICGICGRAYVSRVRKRKDGSFTHRWLCACAVKNGRKEDGCKGRSVSDEVLQKGFLYGLREKEKEQIKQETIENFSQEYLLQITIEKEQIIYTLHNKRTWFYRG